METPNLTAKEEKPSTHDLPVVTLVLAMRNEQAYIASNIDSLLAQDYPSELLEVFIMDGNSSDASWKIVEEKIEGHLTFHLVNNPNIIQSAGWNRGIQLCHGNVIGIVSGHVRLASDYVRNLVETLKRTEADMVGGPTFADSEGYIAQAIALAMNSPFGVGGAAFHYTNREIEVDTVFMGACWRNVYERIGGFDEEMVRNQDDELSYRLRENGGRIICNPAIKSRYYNRATLSGLWKQYFQYGLWKVRVLQKHPHQMRPRQFVPPTFVASLLISGFLSPFWTPGLYLLGSILALYLLANLAASILVASKKGWQYLPLLPLIFAILHLSYGWGFLVGLVRFSNRWGDKQGKVPPLEKLP